MSGVELPDILTTKLLHQASNVADSGKCDEKVCMFFRPHMGMKNIPGMQQGFAKQLKLATPVTAVERTKAIDHFLAARRAAGRLEDRVEVDLPCQEFHGFTQPMEWTHKPRATSVIDLLMPRKRTCSFSRALLPFPPPDPA